MNAINYQLRDLLITVPRAEEDGCADCTCIDITCDPTTHCRTETAATTAGPDDDADAEELIDEALSELEQSEG